MANYPPQKPIKGSVFLLVTILGMIAFGIIMGVGTYLVGHYFQANTPPYHGKKA